ncbi:hypothetical protein [Sphingomonas sp.]|uniref:hypothetical protein n=1 Tax=Sphingomonas sp. TaxID=28214 RepID=UPI003D6D3557
MPQRSRGAPRRSSPATAQPTIQRIPPEAICWLFLAVILRYFFLTTKSTFKASIFG